MSPFWPIFFSLSLSPFFRLIQWDDTANRSANHLNTVVYPADYSSNLASSLLLFIFIIPCPPIDVDANRNPLVYRNRLVVAWTNIDSSIVSSGLYFSAFFLFLPFCFDLIPFWEAIADAAACHRTVFSVYSSLLSNRFRFVWFEKRHFPLVQSSVIKTLYFWGT